MRITACRLDAFGCFRDRTFRDLDHPLVVVRGPNEAGKSTLAAFFEDMLYGFEPTEASRHSYAPREDLRRLEGALAYRSADGTTRTLRRRLTRIPEARLAEAGDGEAMDLRNHPLPAVAHVPRVVFSSVYAPQQSELASLRGAAWEQVRERLLRTTDADFIRAPSAVIEELEAEAAGLWQPSSEGKARKGKARAQELQERRRALRDALNEAKENDRKRRVLHSAISRHTQQLEVLEEERLTLKARLRQARRLRPIHALVAQMQSHEARAGDLKPYADLPDDPGPAFRRLNRQIDRYEIQAAENEEARHQAQRTLDAFTDEDRRVLEASDDIRSWSGRAVAHESRVEHHEALGRDIEQLTAALEERAGRLFTASWSEDLAPTVRSLPKEELRERTRAYLQAADEVDDLQVRADTLARKVDRRKSLWPWAAAAGLGAACYLAGLLLGQALLWGAGAGLLVTGLLQTYTVWAYNRERTERLGELDLQIEEYEEKKAEKSASVAELLREVPLPEEQAAHPDRDLVAHLRDLKRQIEERGALRKQEHALGEALGEAEEELGALAERCGYARPGEEPLPRTVAALERRLAAAEERRDDAEAAEERLQTLRKEQARREPDLEEHRERRDRFEEHLRTLAHHVRSSGNAPLDENASLDASSSSGESDIEVGLEELAARRRAARRGRHARETLFRRYPDWEHLREEIQAHEEEAGTWTYTDEEMVRMEDRRETVAGEIIEEEKARARKRREVQERGRRAVPAAVESEIADVEYRLERTGRRHDRLSLLAGVLRRAAHTFRLRHQPEAIKQAGRYLREITGGRYRRLLLEDGGRLSLRRREESRAQAVAPPLSRGLRAQVGLAVRIAFLDRLDRAQEPLPVFFDEVFAGWDRERRQQGYRILETLARRRQVFLFTCHSALAGELQAQADARVLTLDSLEETESQDVAGRQ